MQGLPIFSNGFKVGIGMLASTAVYQRVLARDLRQIDVEAIVRKWPARTQLEQAVRRSHDKPIVVENAVPQSIER